MYLLIVNEVAEVLQVAPARVYDLIRTEVQPAVRLGRQVRVSEEALAQWIEDGGKALPGGWRRDRPDSFASMRRSLRRGPPLS